ncbi:porin family protein [Hymenobacter humi]|uniref:Porin family protein n=1 Tax=Hymenobacter humi TaxID=1411620 RepID=A0ABW2U381_9BACT
MKKLSSRWSLLPEISFRRQRINLAVEDYHIADGSYTARYRLVLHYLSLPVMARATFGKVYLEAGPYGAFQLAAHETGSESRGTIAGAYEVTFDRPATDRYRRFDVGLGAGAGVQLTPSLGIGLRATTGLLSLTRQEQTYAYSGSLKNRVLEAALSYSLGKK